MYQNLSSYRIFYTVANTKNISKAVNITAEEESLLKELIKDGTEVEIRMVPNDTKVLAEKVL